MHIVHQDFVSQKGKQAVDSDTVVVGGVHKGVDSLEGSLRIDLAENAAYTSTRFYWKSGQAIGQECKMLPQKLHRQLGKDVEQAPSRGNASEESFQNLLSCNRVLLVDEEVDLSLMGSLHLVCRHHECRQGGLQLKGHTLDKLRPVWVQIRLLLVPFTLHTSCQRFGHVITESP